MHHVPPFSVAILSSFGSILHQGLGCSAAHGDDAVHTGTSLTPPVALSPIDQLHPQPLSGKWTSRLPP